MDEKTLIDAPANADAVTAAPKAKRQRLIKTPESKAPIKALSKAKAAVAEKAAIAAAPRARVNVHAEAGVDTSAWNGPSDMLNKNRATKIMVRSNVTPADLTDRQKKALYALRKSYGGRGFPVKGFDNGVMAFLAASGLISLAGGQTADLDGKTYHVDGATPVIGKITAAGAKFGIA